MCKHQSERRTSRRASAAAPAVQVMFMLPFGIWGLMMIVINTIAHAQLATVGSPVALFNLVRHSRRALQCSVALVVNAGGERW